MDPSGVRMRDFSLPKIATSLAALSVALLLPIPPARAQQPDTLQVSMVPPVGIQTEAHLGQQLAMDGPFVVAGAPTDDTANRDSGVVKVFDSATGALLFVLRNPGPADNDRFGSSAAISGARVIVGAPGDDTGAWDAGSVYVYDLNSATPTAPTATLNNPSPALGDSFGRSVAISGMWVVVGAYQDDTKATDAGSAYVYNLGSATPTVPVATLNNPGPANADFFGWSVAISGTRVVVGAYQDDTGKTNAGSAYVYDLIGATPTMPVATLNNPAPGAGDFFGWSVAISGNRVIVGAYGDDTGAIDAGSAYVYDLSSATPTVPVATLNNPDPEAYDCFGYSVAIYGNRGVVGAYSDDTGATGAGSAYVYDLSSAAPTIAEVTLNNPAPAAGDFFGISVGIANMRIVVGAAYDDSSATDSGSAYVYDLGSTTPKVPIPMLDVPGPASGELFGMSVAISGTRVVVGAAFQNLWMGGAYVYDLTSATPATPAFTLNNPDPAKGELFGHSVAISGTRVVIGAPFDIIGDAYAGSAYVYDLASSTPTVPMATLPNPDPASDDYFGSIVAISGTRVVVGAARDDTGATDAGSVYVYDLASAMPTVPIVTVNNPNPATNDNFGIAVAISGAHLAVGAYLDDAGATDRGSAYVYDLDSATPTVPVVTLNNPDPATSVGFGSALAISGTRLVVGGGGYYGGAGSAYVYDVASTTPTAPVATLNNPSPANYDWFGWSVAISGTRVVVGANLDDTWATDAGSAYVYVLSSATPTIPVATLHSPRPEAHDYFGYSVAIDGTAVAIGTPNKDAVMADKGAVDVFGPANRDLDGDGLLDLWEYAHFGSITAHTALDDTDGDGSKELLEMAFNTDPLISDPAAAPAAVIEGGYLTITLNKRAGVSYAVESAGSPENAAFSMATTTTIINNASTLKVRDNFTPPVAAQRFMRVKVKPAP
jgi:hypothetical protein